MRNKISQQLYRLMASHAVSESQLAKLTGINQAIINRILHNKTKNPRIDTVMSLAEYFRISLDQLTGMTDTEHETNAILMVKVPMIEWHQILTRQNNSNPQYIYADVDKKGDYFATELNNQSMLPYIQAGSQIIVDPSQPYTDGDFVVAHTGGSHDVVARQYVNEGGGRLVPTNSVYQSFEMNHDVTIIGTIIRISSALI